jgi:hypothetical protein
MKMSNVVSIKSDHYGQQLAIVDEVQNGRAVTVLWPKKSANPVPVYGHLSHVHVLKKFDEVLVVETEKGIVITGILAEKNQPPAAKIEQTEKALVIRSNTAVRLETDKATIELSADGKVSIDGKVIYQQAEQLLALKGHPVELN